VFNMSLYTLDKDIFKMFEPFAIPTSINIIRDPVTGRSRRYAFVTFASVEDATRARNGTQQATLHERIMRVDYS
ncbi:RNA-binding domain-containing protein, partial [Ramicandelaber brevisporus]